MTTATLIEIIGYLASALVAVSLTMKRILYLRVVNLAGAVVFLLYGLFIQAYPIAITNVIIIGINVYFLYQLLATKDYFRLLEVIPQNKYLIAFLEFHHTDIQRFFPDFTYEPIENRKVFLVLRNMQPTGVFLGYQDGAEFMIELDYVIEGYRDFKSGQYIFRDSREVFTQEGIRRLIAIGRIPTHAAYLKRIGFQEIAAEPTRYVLELG